MTKNITQKTEKKTERKALKNEHSFLKAFNALNKGVFTNFNVEAVLNRKQQWER